MKQSKLHIPVIKALKWLCIAYLLICANTCALQRKLLYHPTPGDGTGSPEAYGLQQFTDVHITDDDGTTIATWYHPARAGYPTVIFFHGNGGNIANHVQYVSALTAAGFGVLAVDYRGYGASEGSPSEQGFYQDARAAIRYVTNEQHTPLTKIILDGQSIGTGVVVQMATEYKAGALVLESPYTSIEDLAAARYPWLPVHIMIMDKFDSLSKIQHVHMPLLLYHGEQDDIIPARFGKALFARANEPKQAIYFPDAGHNDLSMAKRVAALLAFSRTHQLIKE